MSAEDRGATTKQTASDSACVARTLKASEIKAEQVGRELVNDAETCKLPVRLMSGANIDVPISQGETESSLRVRVARTLSRPIAEVFLLVNDRPLKDADLVSPHTVPMLTAVVRAAPALWLDGVLGEVDDVKSVAKLTPVMAPAVVEAFGDLALELKRRVQVSAAMEAVVGFWRYGPRFRDDSYFFGIQFEGDGSCRIMEGNERYTEHYGDIPNETIGATTCEWRGRWWMATPGSEIEVEAFPILEGGQCQSEEMQLVTSGTIIHGRLTHDAINSETMSNRLVPVCPFDLARLGSVPRARGLLRSFV